MQMPNWFDKDFEQALKQAGADQVLAEIAKNPKIRQAVSDALTAHDANAKKPGWAGPSRTQAVRKALVTILDAP
jgi:hypothetical protein